MAAPLAGTAVRGTSRTVPLVGLAVQGSRGISSLAGTATQTVAVANWRAFDEGTFDEGLFDVLPQSVLPGAGSAFSATS